MPGKRNTTFDMSTHFQKLAEVDKASLACELHDELGGLRIGPMMDLGLGEDIQQRVPRSTSTWFSD
jgi:hypothetical protein